MCFFSLSNKCGKFRACLCVPLGCPKEVTVTSLCCFLKDRLLTVLKTWSFFTLRSFGKFWHSSLTYISSVCSFSKELIFGLEFHPHVRATAQSCSFIWFEWERMTNRGHLFLQMLYCNDLISVWHPADEKWMVSSCRQNLTVWAVGNIATWSLQCAPGRDEQCCYYWTCWRSVFTLNLATGLNGVFFLAWGKILDIMTYTTANTSALCFQGSAAKTRYACLWAATNIKSPESWSYQDFYV